MPRSPAFECEELEKAVRMKKRGANYLETAEEWQEEAEGGSVETKRGMERAETEKEREKRFESPKIEGSVFGMSYDDIERYEKKPWRGLETAKVAEEGEAGQPESGGEDEAERLSSPAFRKCLHLFIGGKNNEQIA